MSASKSWRPRSDSDPRRLRVFALAERVVATYSIPNVGFKEVLEIIWQEGKARGIQDVPVEFLAPLEEALIKRLKRSRRRGDA